MKIDSKIEFDPLTGNFITLPQILMFMADRSVVADDRPVTIKWEVEDAKQVHVDRVQVEKIGSKKIICKTHTVVSLLAVAENNFGVRRELKIGVDDRPPVIEWFRVDPDFAIVGSPMKLSWSVTGARNIAIDNGIGDVTGLNSKMITVGPSGVFTLSASNYFGATVKQDAATTVFPSPLISGIFLPEPEFKVSMPVIARPISTVVALEMDSVMQFKSEPIWVSPPLINMYGKERLFDPFLRTEPFFMPDRGS
jgi:hypothetical protein